MAGEAQSDDAPAGCLVFRSTDQPDFERQYFVYPHEELEFGRELIQNLVGCEDPCLSKHHFRIRCISYDGDDTQQIDPLVYARVVSSNSALLSRFGLDDSRTGIAFDKEHPDVLLNGGDRLQLTSKISVVFNTMEGLELVAPAIDPNRAAEKKRFSSRYRVSNRKLGAGGYAAVFVAEKCSTSRQLACKIVPLQVRTNDENEQHDGSRIQHMKQHREKLAREYSLLKDLSHPNIIALEKVIRTSHNIYIFEELVTGGDLISYLDRGPRLAEPQAAIIVRQLLEAVRYLHARNIVHRDIKPENILMTSWRDGARAVLTDFGQSRSCNDIQNAADKSKVLRMQSVVGTHGYAAPEIYRERDFRDGSGYSQAVDIWSIGCVTATMLTNEFIFPDNVTLRRGSVTMSQYTHQLEVLDKEQHWAHIGHRAKSFIRGCLATNEDQRLTAAQCLALPWFQHPHYKAEFDAAYQRAIANWSPREPDGDVIEFMDTSDIVCEEETQEQDTRSRHFQRAPQQPPRPSKKELETMLARFGPDSLRASPIRMPESVSDSYDLDIVDQNLNLASQNTQANLAALHVHARQAPPMQRRKMYR